MTEPVWGHKSSRCNESLSYKEVQRKHTSESLRQTWVSTQGNVKVLYERLPVPFPEQKRNLLGIAGEKNTH